MIPIDASLAIAVFLSIFLGVVFVLWIFYNFYGGSKGTVVEPVEDVQQCPYCTYVFINYAGRGMVMCPRCHSYIGDSQKEASQNDAAPIKDE